jgi:P-type E1-E2 ATPase
LITCPKKKKKKKVNFYFLNSGSCLPLCTRLSHTNCCAGNVSVKAVLPYLIGDFVELICDITFFLTWNVFQVGTSLGATRGLLWRGGNILEKFSMVDTIVFDKTGTLTIGRPVVTKVVTPGRVGSTDSKLSVDFFFSF